MKQLVRYAVVGVVTNALGYLVYLGVTWVGLGPKLAVSLLYGAGVTASFLGNRRWTFRHQGDLASGGVRFVVAHATGYLLNLALLLVFVDRIGWPHQLVQAAAILVVAAYLFVLMRVFVFPPQLGSAR
jgi:putative flippase GtrA